MMRTVSAMALCVAAAGAAAEPLTFAVGDEYPPYVDQALPDGGKSLALLRAAAERAGFEPAVDVSTWNRAMELTRNGNADLTFPWSYTEERSADYLATLPIHRLEEYVFVAAGSPALQSREDFVGTSGCYPTGFQTTGFLSEMFESGEVTRHSAYTMDLCFRMLNAGRVDFVLSGEGEGIDAITLAGLDPAEFAMGLEPHTSDPQVVLVSRAAENAEEIVEKLNAALVELQEDEQWYDQNARF